MLERTRTSLRSLSSRLSRRQQVQGSDAELLAQLAQQIDPATYAALHGTCELPGLGDAQQERDALLRRYLEAEKRCVAGAAARLAQQAEWRRRFGTVTEVCCCILRQTCIACIQGLCGTGRPQPPPCACVLPSQEQVPAQIAAQKVLLQPPPPAAPAARPLVVVAVRRHLPAGGGDLAELERFIVLILDTASAYCWDARSNPPAQLAALFDLRGARAAPLGCRQWAAVGASCWRLL